MCCAGCGWRAGELPSRQLAGGFPQGGQHSICTYLHRLCTPVFAQACTHIDIIDFDINPDRIAPAGEQALPPIELRLLLDLRGMNCHKSQPLSLPRFLIAVRSKSANAITRKKSSFRKKCHPPICQGLCSTLYAKARMIFNEIILTR
jgi:hypothetical protein